MFMRLKLMNDDLYRVSGKQMYFICPNARMIFIICLSIVFGKTGCVEE